MHVLYTPKFIQNGKDIILGGRELHIKIIHGASLSPVRKQVTWGCQWAAAMGLSVLLPWVQPVRVSARFICVPGWEGLLARDRPVLCLSVQSKGKWPDPTRLWKDHRAPFPWSPECLSPRLVLQRTLTKDNPVPVLAAATAWMGCNALMLMPVA